MNNKYKCVCREGQPCVYYGHIITELEDQFCCYLMIPFASLLIMSIPYLIEIPDESPYKANKSYYLNEKLSSVDKVLFLMLFELTDLVKMILYEFYQTQYNPKQVIIVVFMFELFILACMCCNIFKLRSICDKNYRLFVIDKALNKYKHKLMHKRALIYHISMFLDD